ncbi:MAG: VWA domain-containing protein [Candidatus Methanomethylicia archaeon]
MARDIIYAIDVSDSMCSRGFKTKSRLDMVKEALIKLISDKSIFNSDDRLAIIGFHAEALSSKINHQVIIPLTPVKLIAASDIKRINNLKGHGRTALGAGLRKAFEILLENDIGNEKLIVLVTDGRNNSGEHPYASMQDIVKHNVKVYTLGLGSDFDKTVLKVLADKTGGLHVGIKDKCFEYLLLHPDKVSLHFKTESSSLNSCKVENICSSKGVLVRYVPAPIRTTTSKFKFQIQNLSPVRLSDKIYLSGMGITPNKWKKYIAALFAFSILPSIAYFIASFCLNLDLLSVLIPYPYDLLAVIGLSISISLILYYTPAVKASIFQSKLRRELPWIASYFVNNAAIGIPPTVSLERVIGLEEVFPAFARLARMVSKIRILKAMDPFSAIAWHADKFTDPDLRDFLISMASTQRSGGNIYVVLREKLQALYAEMRSSLEVLGEKFNAVASFIFMIYVLLPIFMLSIGIILGGVNGSIILTSFFILNTFFSFICCLLVDALIPKELLAKPSYKPLAILPLGLILIPVKLINDVKVTLLFDKLYYFIALAIIVGLTLPSIYALKTRGKQKKIIYAIPSFLRDVSERVKKGESPGLAIRWLSSNRSYNKCFDEALRRISAFMHSGARIGEAARLVEIPWAAKVSFELLDTTEQTGADPSLVEFIVESINQLFTAMRMLKARVRFFKLIVYLSVCMITFTVALSSIVMNILSLTYQQAGGLAGQMIGVLTLPKAEDVEYITTMASVGAMYTAVLLGLIGGKGSDGGSLIDGLPHALICTVLTVFLLYIMVDTGLLYSILGVSL